jgi:hypothetical protein
MGNAHSDYINNGQIYAVHYDWGNIILNYKRVWQKYSACPSCTGKLSQVSTIRMHVFQSFVTAIWQFLGPNLVTVRCCHVKRHRLTLTKALVSISTLTNQSTVQNSNDTSSKHIQRIWKVFRPLYLFHILLRILPYSKIKSNQILFVTYTWLAYVNASVAKCLCF